MVGLSRDAKYPCLLPAVAVVPYTFTDLSNGEVQTPIEHYIDPTRRWNQLHLQQIVCQATLPRDGAILVLRAKRAWSKGVDKGVLPLASPVDTTRATLAQAAAAFINQCVLTCAIRVLRAVRMCRPRALRFTHWHYYFEYCDTLFLFCLMNPTIAYHWRSSTDTATTGVHLPGTHLCVPNE